MKAYTDHKNLTYKSSNTERVMRWQLNLEEFRCELIYIQVSIHIVADALSCLDNKDSQNNTNSHSNNKVEPILESLSENFALNKEDVFHPTRFKLL